MDPFHVGIAEQFLTGVTKDLLMGRVDTLQVTIEARNREQVARVVQAVDVESRFSQQMGVSSLPAWHVQNSRS